MNGGVLSKLLTNGYRSASKELKDAVNFRLYDESPELFQMEQTGNLLGEGGSSTIPRIHVDDLKHYFGRTEDIPSRYKRTTGKRDIDELASMAGYDDIDNFVESIQGELSSRSVARENKKLLSERRNDQDFLAETQKILDNERALYGSPEVFEPSTRDYQWYLKNMAEDTVDGQKRTGMENFKINRNDISYDLPQIALQYMPSTYRVPVRTSRPEITQPAAPQSVVPLSSNAPAAPMVSRPSSGMANILTLQAAMGTE